MHLARGMGGKAILSVFRDRNSVFLPFSIHCCHQHRHLLTPFLWKRRVVIYYNISPFFWRCSVRNIQSSRELSVLAVRLQMVLASTFKHRIAYVFRGFEVSTRNPTTLRENLEFDCSGMSYLILHLLQVGGNSFKYSLNVCGTYWKEKKKKKMFLNRSFKHSNPCGGAKVTKDESSQTHSYKMCRRWPDEIWQQVQIIAGANQ